MPPVNGANLHRHELIGLRAKVLKSCCKGYEGLQGRVLDETRNLLTLGTIRAPKKIPKRGSIFEFTLHDGDRARIDGGVLVGRPEDRVLRE